MAGGDRSDTWSLMNLYNLTEGRRLNPKDPEVFVELKQMARQLLSSRMDRADRTMRVAFEAKMERKKQHIHQRNAKAHHSTFKENGEEARRNTTTGNGERGTTNMGGDTLAEVEEELRMKYPLETPPREESQINPKLLEMYERDYFYVEERNLLQRVMNSQLKRALIEERKEEDSLRKLLMLKDTKIDALECMDQQGNSSNSHTGSSINLNGLDLMEVSKGRGSETERVECNSRYKCLKECPNLGKEGMQCISDCTSDGATKELHDNCLHKCLIKVHSDTEGTSETQQDGDSIKEAANSGVVKDGATYNVEEEAEKGEKTTQEGGRGAAEAKGSDNIADAKKSRETKLIAPPGKVMNWAAMMGSTSTTRDRIKPIYQAPTIVDGVPTTMFKSKDFESSIKDHEGYLVGNFVGRRLDYTYVKNVLTRVWELKGSFEMILQDNLFYFKFGNKKDRDKVLEMGTQYVANRVFMIRMWRPLSRRGSPSVYSFMGVFPQDPFSFVDT
ncbi:hypothetical protein GIB67_036397 [Kingdonia uniflora]|uniref:DUF4283 domain-containing protein n=1 Tax=Kingdonia uniflora TaxID=39325 RepID=A0A7J7L414_9MAGN|nr:hypothetical protein GIB67_036397 [Kingdonia uniflora]